jgi:hypothetical protein
MIKGKFLQGRELDVLVSYSYTNLKIEEIVGIMFLGIL